MKFVIPAMGRFGKTVAELTDSKGRVAKTSFTGVEFVEIEPVECFAEPKPTFEEISIVAKNVLDNGVPGAVKVLKEASKSQAELDAEKAAAEKAAKDKADAEKAAIAKIEADKAAALAKTEAAEKAAAAEKAEPAEKAPEAKDEEPKKDWQPPQPKTQALKSK